jgi:hypothetical protein
MRAAAFIALASCIWAACHPTDQRPTVPNGTQWVRRFTCPEGRINIPVIVIKNVADTVQDSLQEIPLSGPVAEIPEYHDCQRFIDANNRYGSLFAIFASFRLDTVNPLSPVTATPLATIYTPDGDYPQLGIRPGFNCLFLAGSGKSWTAKMIPWGSNKNNCADGHITPGPGVGTDLAVQQQPVSPEFRPQDFPPVARWDRDAADRDYTIGMRCGAAWCEIGKPGFVRSAGYNGPPLTFDAIGGKTPSATAQRRVQTIKGWFDVQRLAERNDASPTLHPTPFRGFLIPHPALDSLAWLKWKSPGNASLDSYYALGWIHVGYAYMEGDYSKWNFRKGRNKIFMCFGMLGGNCKLPEPIPQAEHPSAYTLLKCPPDPDPATPARHWWAKTVPESGPQTYVCVQRMDHRKALLAWAGLPENANVSFSIPATARWRFMPADESGWWGCATGCCTKQ